MNISLKTLIKVAPFPQKDREMLFKRYDELNEDDKYKISNAVWRALSIQYFTRLQSETNLILYQIQEGKRSYNPNDFEEIKARLIHELTQKLELAQNQESVEEVKKELEKYKTQPLPNDQSTSSPPSQKS